ncbi:MAG TPA: UDP-N-acetylglucosamine 2-epimerase (non-hydrolyzing) [Bacteroidia bacterium]|nr:UDP-N-acetylglucosamine 2-epimerase (non-hydrolyzing) [Bacteroidia bacterium]
MKRKQILTIVGARPQFVKAAVVSRELALNSAVEEKILHTGQHYDFNMSDVFFGEMKIPKPAFQLAVKETLHGAMTAEMLKGIEKILLEDKPDLVIVYGDTNSTLAGALAAKKVQIPLAHIEAGLRSFNLEMPEEINRILTDRISDFLFCPTDTAMRNLEMEGFMHFPCVQLKSGDVMKDAVDFYSVLAAEKSGIIREQKLESFLLCTLHREQNTNDKDRLLNIMDALNTLNEDCPVLMPLHPRTKKFLAEHKIHPKFKTIDPVSYFDMLELLRHCRMVLTDSGGLQKEAFFFQKPCITLREETEWIELVEHGFNILGGADKQRILSAYREMLKPKRNFDIDLYGDGHAAARIVNSLL